MERWDLGSLAPSSDKSRARDPGADATRTPTVGRQKPRVLFSHPECRGVVVDLERGEELGDHRVRERAVVQVVSGRVSIASSQGVVECDAHTLLTFEPGEPHALRALDDTRLLLLLAPWPAEGHNTESEAEHDLQRLPANAVAEPLPSA